MKLQQQDRITWHSAAGELTGTIEAIVLADNAAGQTCPWIDVRVEGRANTVRLCANDGYLRQMRVELVTTREVRYQDLVERVNIMTGKKYLEPRNTPVFMSPACESYWSM
jgi:hypothetical protein